MEQTRMAFDMRQHAKGHTTKSNAEEDILKGLAIVEDCVSQHCFTALGFVQQTAARIGVFIAAKAVAAGHAKYNLKADGWTVVNADADETGLSGMLEKAYAREIATQKARVALRKEQAEVSDDYFVPDDEEPNYFPELTLFRQQVAVERECV